MPGTTLCAIDAAESKITKIPAFMELTLIEGDRQ